MAKQETRQDKKTPQRREAAETEAKTATTKRGQDIKKDLDKLMDEIDDVLEENAEEFVQSYVQRGGE
jgi:ubiquitin-like protein Pup